MTRKSLLILVIINFFTISTLFAQYDNYKDRFTFEDYNLNSQVKKTKSDNDDESLEFDGFITTVPYDLDENDDSKNLRFDNYILPNAFGTNLPKITANFFYKRIQSIKCEDLVSDISIAYPVNTGSEASDAYIKSIIEPIFHATISNFLDDMTESLGPENTCKNSISDTKIYQTSFQIFSPSSNIISILFYTNILTGYFHPINRQFSMNINTQTGQKLLLTDIFPKIKVSIKKLWPFLANNYCNSEYHNGETLPNAFDNAPCQPGGFNESSPPPQKWSGKTIGLDDLADAVYMSPMGLYLYLDAYNSWGYSSGPAVVFIPKAEAVAMGASDSIWE